jgi:uncharacterized protein (TIGR02246 family)
MKNQQSFVPIALVAFVLLCFMNCAPAPEDDSAIRDAIAAEDERFMEAFKQGDAAAVAELYTEDGQLLPPNSGFVSGKQSIQEFWQGAMNMGIKSAKLETVEVKGYGELAYEVGRYTLFADGDQMIDQGKYIVILKKVEGAWKWYRDIWNSSQPAP